MDENYLKNWREEAEAEVPKKISKRIRELGSAQGPNPKKIAELMEFAKDDSWRVQFLALVALREIEARYWNTYELAVELASDPESVRQVRIVAGDLCNDINCEMIESMKSLSKNRSKNVKLESIQNLAEGGFLPAVPLISKHAKSNEPCVSKAAEKALASLRQLEEQGARTAEAAGRIKAIMPDCREMKPAQNRSK